MQPIAFIPGTAELLVLAALSLLVFLIIIVSQAGAARGVMKLPTAVEAAQAKLDPEMRNAFVHDYVKRRNSLLVAYITWLLLGWHYLYLGTIGLQFAFWFTAGGLFIWWFLDLFRMPGVVARHNEDVARELMTQYRMMA